MYPIKLHHKTLIHATITPQHMGAINPQRVAAKVSQTIREGKLVDLEDIIVSCGYSATTAKRSGMVTNTKAYKQAMAIEHRPLLEGIQAEINRIKLAISKKDLSQEDTRTLVYAMDIMTKNFQLLSGGATERQVFVLPSQVIGRNSIAITEDTKPVEQLPTPNDGSTKP